MLTQQAVAVEEVLEVEVGAPDLELDVAVRQVDVLLTGLLLGH